MSRRVILAITDLSGHGNLPQHEILCKHIFDVSIDLTYRICVFSHAIFAKTPFTNAGELSVPYLFANSTASLIATFVGISSSNLIS